MSTTHRPNVLLIVSDDHVGPAMYYRYWMHLAHFNIPAHYGVRTERYKLIYLLR